jgi:phosphohistidine phosphatase
LRHAKSEWSDPASDDHERPLARRGRRAAERMGEEIARRGIAPECVLCSSARRAIETLDRIRPHLPDPVAVVVDRELYLAGPERLLARIAAVDDRVRTLLLVAHHPGLAELAALLAAGGDVEALASLRRKFPTGALADLRVASAGWRDLAPGSGTLGAFLTPRELERESG